jgi:DNA gyrase subunit A
MNQCYNNVDIHQEGKTHMKRPDLSNVDEVVRAYIVYLEDQLRACEPIKKSRSATGKRQEVDRVPDTHLPAEPPTSINILTVSYEGIAKRTHRHHYSPQHRSGMGVFDLEVPEPDYPAILTSVDENQNLIVFTNQARVFRINLNKVPAMPLRSRGQTLLDRVQLDDGERIAAILPERAQGYIALVSANGRVRTLRHHLFGEHMRPGTAMYSYRDHGPLSSVCWTTGDADLFILTKNGMAIRFNEKVVPPQGENGIRLLGDDKVVAITSVYDESGVFMIGADGKGTTRLMSGFAPNKSAGGSGKIATRNTRLVAAAAVGLNDSIFIITRLGKIIRFRADEVPPTEGVIQGVNCISMRADEVVAMTRSGLHDAE